MEIESDSRNARRYLLPAVAFCIVVVLVSFSGCTGLPGMNFLQGSGSSTGSTTPPAVTTTVPAQGSGTAGQGSGGMSCPAPYESWTACPDGNCYDLTSNPAHCGSCTTRCGSGQTCTSGHCAAGIGASGAQQESAGGLTCPAPYESWTVCDGNCYDLTSDPTHCGSCTTRCGSGQTCSSGQCSGGGGTAQPSGSCDAGSWCPNMCTNLKVDNWNCGDCGTRCEEGTACFNGVCTPTSCPNQAWSCSGHCALLMGDMPPLNCGGCGIACPSGQMCYSGICKDFTGSGLPQGYHVCGKYFGCKQGNDDPCKEFDPTTSFCGYGKTLADGGTFPFLNCCSSTQTCVNGQCQGSNCATGQTSCNGACVNTQTDESNCGSCGHACGSGQICFLGRCGTDPSLDVDIRPQISLERRVPLCYSPYDLCSGDCVNTQTDENNCGSCGNVCASGATCTEGSCKCPTGYYVSNGACSRLAVDPDMVKPVVSVYVKPNIIKPNLINP